MATWKDLYAMLVDEKLTADEIVDRLNVKPSRLKQLLGSYRLFLRLKAVADTAALRCEHAVAVGGERAARKLSELATLAKAETARKACLDVMEKAELARETRTKIVDDSKAPWASWRRAGRRDARAAAKAAREGRPAPAPSADAFPPRAPGTMRFLS